MKWSLLTLTLAAAMPLAPRAALADVAADAKEHFLKGSQLYHSAQYKEAIAEFQAAYDLRPAGVLHYNIAQCYEKLGDIPNALRSYHNYLRETPNADDRATVEVAIGHLEQRLAETGVQQVLIYSDPPGAQVMVDGKAVGPTPAAVQLPPGAHLVAVSKDGYANAQQQAMVARDKSLELSFSLQHGAAAPLVLAPDSNNAAGVSAATPPAGGLTSSSQPAPETGPSHLASYIAGGAAGAALVTGILLGVGANANDAVLHNSTVRSAAGNTGWADRATSEALGANVCYGVAGVAALAAIGLFIFQGGF